MITAFIVQLTVLDYFKIFGAKPDIIIALVIFYAIFFGPGRGLEAGFVAGLLKDIFSVDIFGVNTLSLALTGYIVGIFSPKLFRESISIQAMLVFVFTFISMLLHYFIGPYISKMAYISTSEYIFGLIIPASLYTSAVSVIIFAFLIKRYSLKENEEYL